MAAVCSLVTGTVPAFLRPQGQGNASQRTLTFEERVSYQRAIEDVYWRHRIWPKERPDPKPSLDAVMSQAQLEKKVTDYLRNSQALEDYWQRPITDDQLQAELRAQPSIEQMTQLCGKYSEIEFVKSEGAHDEDNHAAGRGMKLNASEW